MSNQDDPIVSFGNPELDRRVGGLPIPSLTLIEGANDSGKSIMTQQITFGALSDSKKVLLVSTENRAKEILGNMKDLGWDISNDYLVGRFSITHLNLLKTKWSEGIAELYLVVLYNYLRKKAKSYDLVIVDSLTFLVTRSGDVNLVEFFRKVKELVDTIGNCFVITIHQYALEKTLLTRLRVICDGDFQLEKKTFRDRTALTMTLSKLRGAVTQSGDMISFEVAPGFGVKILPFTSARG